LNKSEGLKNFSQEIRKMLKCQKNLKMLFFENFLKTFSELLAGMSITD